MADGEQCLRKDCEMIKLASDRVGERCEEAAGGNVGDGASFDGRHNTGGIPNWIHRRAIVGALKIEAHIALHSAGRGIAVDEICSHVDESRDGFKSSRETSLE